MTYRNLPSLTALRAFAAYADTGSVVKAGDALNVTHGAISQQIKQLEAQLGLKLIDRSRRALTVTDDGQQLARALGVGFGAITEEIDRLTNVARSKPLQVSTTPIFATEWLIPRLTRFQKAEPDINLTINPTPTLITLGPGGPDLAIRFGAGDWPGTDTELLIATDTVVAAAPSLIKDAPTKKPQDLQGFRWLVEENDVTTQDWLQKNELDRSKLRSIQMPGHLMPEAARRGQGIIVAAFSNLAPDIEAGRLTLLFRDGKKSGYHVVTPSGAVLRPQARAFIRWLRQEKARTDHRDTGWDVPND